MKIPALCSNIVLLALSSLVTAQWAFTTPDGDLGELAPGNNVRKGDIHNFVWAVGVVNQPVRVLDANGFCSLWITSGNDQSFSKLLATSVNSTNGGSWAWEVSLLDSVIDAADGVFIYRLERPVSSTSALYDWNTPLSVSSVSFRILKASDTETTTAAAPVLATTQSPPQSPTQVIQQTTIVQQIGTTLLTTIVTGNTNGIPVTQNNAGTTGSPTANSSPTGSPSSSSPASASAPSSSLSTGAKAGIAIGAVGAVALLAIAGLLLFRRKRSKPATETPAVLPVESTGGMAQGHGMMDAKPAPYVTATHAPATNQSYAWAHGGRPVELGTNGAMVERYELPQEGGRGW